MDEERAAHRGRRDAETLRDAEEIRSTPERVKNAMKHLDHARKAMEAGRKKGKRKGFRENVRD